MNKITRRERCSQCQHAYVEADEHGRDRGYCACGNLPRPEYEASCQQAFKAKEKEHSGYNAKLASKYKVLQGGKGIDYGS
ncbi:MAG: hypothetical protein FWH42_01380 [Dehalococcoidia bacterium]|nr:hypothetical protein [Dehalococcoidia bacterium]